MTDKTHIRISEQAAAILAVERNAYWRPTAPDIQVEAIEFTEASFLAGPFEEKFGLVYIAHTPDALPLQQQLDATAAEVMDARSTTYLPYEARKRINELYPKGVEFHYDRVARQSYSELDMAHLDDTVRGRLESKGERCGAFASTQAGRKVLFETVTAEEQAEHRVALERAVARIHVEMRVVQRSAERPYSLKLQGNDDASWTATCVNMAEVEGLLADLRRRGYAAVADRMYFTN